MKEVCTHGKKMPYPGIVDIYFAWIRSKLLRAVYTVLESSADRTRFLRKPLEGPGILANYKKV